MLAPQGGGTERKGTATICLLFYPRQKSQEKNLDPVGTPFLHPSFGGQMHLRGVALSPKLLLLLLLQSVKRGYKERQGVCLLLGATTTLSLSLSKVHSKQTQWIEMSPEKEKERGGGENAPAQLTLILFAGWSIGRTDRHRRARAERF